ncbi:MAG: hypothetical protein PHT60_03675 [Acidiphilium sp.]|nr:hypothetical protein [Acidiphilium sp.]MDD4934857.1 hypothetical protein [Acidiphilium sp.]
MTRTARLAILLAPIGLAACAGGNTPALHCPQVAVLQQASRVVRGEGGSNDIAAQTIDARITGVAGKCSLASKNMERVTFRIGFTATNGPASHLTSQTLPYFIAITQSDRIIGKKIYPVTFDFRNGSEQAVASTTPIRLSFPRAARSETQQVLVGFQMTPAEIDRSNGAAPTR